MTSAGRCALTLLALLLLFAVPAQAEIIIGQIGTDYNLQTVMTAGGIRVGDKVFDSFSVGSNVIGNVLAPTASSMSVRPVLVDGDYGLRFDGPWLALQNQAIDTAIDFCVTADAPNLIVSDQLRMTNQGQANGGAVSITESVYKNNPDATSELPLDSKMIYQVDATHMITDVDLAFGPVAQLWVQKNVIVTGGTLEGGLGHLSIFYQTFHQVPEPVTMLVLAAGGLALLRRRVR